MSGTMYRSYGLVRIVFFLMIRRPPRSTQSRSSAASDVYKRQAIDNAKAYETLKQSYHKTVQSLVSVVEAKDQYTAVSYTHLRAHETVLDLVCRLLLEKKKTTKKQNNNTNTNSKSINNITRQTKL